MPEMPNVLRSLPNQGAKGVRSRCFMVRNCPLTGVNQSREYGANLPCQTLVGWPQFSMHLQKISATAEWARPLSTTATRHTPTDGQNSTEQTCATIDERGPAHGRFDAQCSQATVSFSTSQHSHLAI